VLSRSFETGERMMASDLRLLAPVHERIIAITGLYEKV
jgi:hypothetical protein